MQKQQQHGVLSVFNYMNRNIAGNLQQVHETYPLKPCLPHEHVLSHAAHRTRQGICTAIHIVQYVVQWARGCQGDRDPAVVAHVLIHRWQRELEAIACCVARQLVTGRRGEEKNKGIEYVGAA